MTTYIIYCKVDPNSTTNPREILVKNGDFEHPDVGWYSTADESNTIYDLLVDEGDIVKVQLIENSGIYSLDNITVEHDEDASRFFVLPLVTNPAKPAKPPYSSIAATVKADAPRDPEDYWIWYTLPNDTATSYPHDPKIRINSK